MSSISYECGVPQVTPLRYGSDDWYFQSTWRHRDKGMETPDEQVWRNSGPWRNNPLICRRNAQAVSEFNHHCACKFPSTRMHQPPTDMAQRQSYTWFFHIHSLLWCRIRFRWSEEVFQNGPLQWRQNERDSISNHQPHDCLFNCSFRRRSKKTSKLRVTGLCARNSPVTGEFPAQRPVTRKKFPCDDVIVRWNLEISCGTER